MDSKEKLSEKVIQSIRQHGIEKALETPVEGGSVDPLERVLFGNDDKRGEKSETAAYAGLTFGDIFYEMSCVDPKVIEALDFSSKQDIDNVFDFAKYAKDRMESTGSMAVGEFSRLKGYVAEQFVAIKLKNQGYETEFPETANQAGYDLIVDGRPMQVKCSETIQLVQEHFEKYPDIPVLANSDLADKVVDSGRDWVDKVFYVEGYDIQTIEDITGSSLDAGAEVFDYEIPLFASCVLATRNLVGWWRRDVSLGNALTTAAAEATAKIPLAGAGALAGKGLGLLIFGPAGGVVFGGVMAVAGASQSRKVISMIKKWLNQKEAEGLKKASDDMLDILSEGLSNKTNIIDKKIGKIRKGNEVADYVIKRLKDERTYFEERGNEIECVRRKHSDDPTELAVKTFEMIRKSKVHPVLYQQQLKRLLEILEEAQKAIKRWPKIENPFRNDKKK
jgi:hypothetical protein